MDEMEEKKRKKMVAVENRSWHLTGFHVHVSLNARPEQGSMESVLTAIHFLVWNLSAKSWNLNVFVATGFAGESDTNLPPGLAVPSSISLECCVSPSFVRHFLSIPPPPAFFFLFLLFNGCFFVFCWLGLFFCASICGDTCLVTFSCVK